MRLQPGRGHDGEAVQRKAHGFAHQFQAVERPDSREDVGGIGALGAPRFEQATLVEECQECLQQEVHRLPLDQTRAELA